MQKNFKVQKGAWMGLKQGLKDLEAHAGAKRAGVGEEGMRFDEVSLRRCRENVRWAVEEYWPPHLEDVAVTLEAALRKAKR